MIHTSENKGLLRILGHLARHSGDESAPGVAVMDPYIPIHHQQIHLSGREVLSGFLLPVALTYN